MYRATRQVFIQQGFLPHRDPAYGKSLEDTLSLLHAISCTRPASLFSRVGLRVYALEPDKTKEPWSASPPSNARVFPEDLSDVGLYKTCTGKQEDDDDRVVIFVPHPW